MMSLPTVRATDREREGTVDVLCAAFAAGCLDSGELADRAARAYAAVTIDDLYRLISDLPSEPEPEPGPCARPSGHAARRALGWEFSLMLTTAGIWLIVIALHSAAAVPVILLWLVALRGLGRLPRLTARHATGSRKRQS
jgi:hypothetical protein